MPKSMYSKKYADGGEAKGSKPKEVEPKPQPEMLGTGAARRTGETLRNRRRQQMEELGLKDGGRVPKVKKNPRGRSYKDGGVVSRYPLSRNSPTAGPKY